MTVPKRTAYAAIFLLFGLAENVWAAGNGLKAEFFNNTSLVGTPVLVRTDPAIDFDWGTGSPAASIAPNTFSARWSGQLEAPATGAYTFRVEANRGIRVRLNNKLIINGWTSSDRSSDPRNLLMGQKYDIEVEYFETAGTAKAKLFWTVPGQKQAIVPQSQLFSDPVTPGLAVPPVYVSSLNPLSSQNGLGPYERDTSNGQAQPGDGHAIAINEVKFAKGLGVSAVSELRYALAGKYTDFGSDIGVDDEVDSRGTVLFQVWLDGVKAFESPKMTGRGGAKSVSLDVTGKQELKLVVISSDKGTARDHADWADARLIPVGKLPAAPGGLTAAPGNGKVILSWMMTAGANSYRVYRGRVSDMERSTPIAEVTGVTFTDPGRKGDREYFYKVAAVNAAGTGAKSKEASTKPGGTPPPTTLPAPTGLTAAPGDGQIVLTWAAVSGVTGYNVYRGTSAGGEASSPIAANVPSPTLNDKGLTNGTAYFYKVAAVNANGPGEKSKEASATPTTSTPPPVLPPAPSGLTAMPGDKQVMLAWTSVSGAASYKVFRGTSAGAESPTPVASGLPAPSFNDTGLTNGITYFYRVAAVNAAGTGGLSNETSAKPAGMAGPPAPAGLTATPGDKKVVLSWTAVSGATGYNVYRGTSAGGEAASPVASNVPAPTFTDTGLTNGTTYFYKVAAVNANGAGEKSNEASAKPAATPLPAPSGLTATPGDKQVVLSWNAVTGATGYNVYRGTSAGGEAANPVGANVSAAAFTDTGLTNGTTYFYKVSAIDANGTGEKSAEASAKPAPAPPPPAPTGLTVLPGDKQNQLTWNAVNGATSYNVYRGTKANGESTTALMTGITAASFTDIGLTNGTIYFYKVASVGATGTSDKSSEASGMPTAPGLLLSDAQKEAFRFLRQSTFGPTPALVNHVVQVGKSAFIDEQLALPPTPYPDALITMPNMELVSEQMMQNAIQGPDQLRQRVAWALSQIFVVSASKVDNTHAMVPFIRMLEQRAFDNVKDVMHDVTLSPAMGEFLDMVNNKKAIGATLPNENYAREWLQLLSIGLQELNDDGTPMLTNGQPTPTYTQASIADMARVLTGWTYGDAKATNPTGTNPSYYDGPMKPVDKYHDTGEKTVLGTLFNAGQTTQQDFDQALSVVFNHHNVGPFLVRELIQRLVTSNPSPTYIGDVVAVFNNNGQGVRGDLKAVVKAILLHPEAANGTPTSGKLSEPVLFLTTLTRALGASVVDHPFLTDFSQSMAQQVWFAPSVFNYFSPNYRVNGLFAPEMQIWTTANAMTRTNFIASLISGGFGADVTIDYSPYTAVAADPNALVDTVNSLIMGGTMSAPMRQAILTSLQVTTGATERIRTAIYLAASSMQYQVEH